MSLDDPNALIGDWFSASAGDANQPPGEDPRTQGDDQIRRLKGTVRRHFPNFAGTAAAPKTVNASEDEINTLVGVSLSEPIVTLPPGTSMLFYQDVAPPGWTIVNTADDVDVRITNGTGNGGIQGGVIGGTYDYSAVFDSTLGEGATPGVADKVLDLSHIPVHDHEGGVHKHPMGWTNQAGATAIASGTRWHTSAPGSNGSLSGVVPATEDYIRESVSIITPQGGGLGHAHSLDIRVKYAPCIIAALDP